MSFALTAKPPNSALRYHNRPRERLEIEHGAAVAVGAGQRAAVHAAARRDGEVVAADLTGEGGGIELEAGVARELHADVAGKSLQFVMAVLRQRPREGDAA